MTTSGLTPGHRSLSSLLFRRIETHAIWFTALMAKFHFNSCRLPSPQLPAHHLMYYAYLVRAYAATVATSNRWSNRLPSFRLPTWEIKYMFFGMCEYRWRSMTRPWNRRRRKLAALRKDDIHTVSSCTPIYDHFISIPKRDHRLYKLQMHTAGVPSNSPHLAWHVNCPPYDHFPHCAPKRDRHVSTN